MSSSSLKNALGGSVQLSTGQWIPLVGLGTYKITGESVEPCVDAALGAGYRLFDTAKYYYNEQGLGDALAKLLPKHGLTREDVFITTKFFPAPENNFEHAKKQVQESLDALKTTYIDLVLIHYPKCEEQTDDDPRNAVNRKDAYKALVELKGTSSIRAVGVSNYEARHLVETVNYGLGIPAVNQVEFHPHFTRVSIREACKEHGVFFQAFTSLARQNPDLIGDPVVTRIAQKHNTSPQMVLLAWPLGLGVGIVPKSANPARIVSNFEVIKLKLAEDELAELGTLNRDKNYTRCAGWLVL